METERRREQPGGGDGSWRSTEGRPQGDGRAQQRLDLALSQLRHQARERPYLTLTACFGAGLILGGGLPLRAMIAVLGLGARGAAASALEGALRRSFATSPSSEERAWSAR